MISNEAGKPPIFEACGVPFRWRDGRAEFCLVSIERDSRWEFPHCRRALADDPGEAAVQCARKLAAVDGRLSDREALEQFSAPQGESVVEITSYLVEVMAEAKSPAERRTRWAFAEEAKARIRRKPMRRLVDLAVRRLESN